ncbi:MAG: hypothetical protein IIB44_05275 [Candidatus Marinimicrobia bacterium]|nr:hypothetical protein [Candidatus Neomarinimicrobiota bacterium]
MNIRNNKLYSLVVILFLWTFSGLFGADFNISINRPGLLIMEAGLDSVWIDESRGSQRIRVSPDTKLLTRSGFPEIPYLHVLLEGVPQNANVQVFFSTADNLSLVNPAIIPEERAKGIDMVFSPGGSVVSRYPSTDYRWKPVGDVGGIPIQSLEVYPVVVENLSQVHVRRQVTVRIQWNLQDSSPIQAGFYKGDKSSYPPRSLNRMAKISSDIPEYFYSENLVKIVVDTTGWFVLTKDALRDSGVVLSGVDPRTFQLWHRGQEKLLWVEGEEDGHFSKNDVIIFYGERNPSNRDNYSYNYYTDDNCYWLTWGKDNGVRYAEELGYPNLPEDQVLRFSGFPAVIHIERNESFNRLGNVGLHDTWDKTEHFFMKPPINEGTSVNFQLIIPHPRRTDNYLFSIAARFQGITGGSHNVSVFINGVKSAVGDWSGQSSHIITSSQSLMWPNSNLQHGINILNILLGGENIEVGYDQVLLDWIEVKYERLYWADSSYIEFTRPADLDYFYQFEIGGFLSPEIFLFKNDVSRIRDFIIEYDEFSQSYMIIFQDWVESDDIQYTAFSSEALLTPKSILQVDPVETPLSTGGSEYLIITPEIFSELLEQFAEMRNATIIEAEEIYRQYNDGVLSPYAIRNFLTDVLNNWTPVPRYVLLVGVAHIWRTDEVTLPAMFYNSYGWGATATDYWYALIEGNDFIPEFHIGRFPASNEEELVSIIEKTIAYISNEEADTWLNRFLMIGGYELAFKNQSESFIDKIIMNGFFAERLYIDSFSEGGPYFGNTDSLVNHINRGLVLLNFLGHGGGAIWGDRSLFTLSDLELLGNGYKMPFITSMTCFTGDMTNPYSLGRKLMVHEEGGAIAFFSSTGIGWIINDYLLLQPIFSNLLTEEFTLGEALDLGKIFYIAHNDIYPDIGKSQLFQYNLLGDPALRLNFPQKKEITILPQDPQPGEDVTFSGFMEEPDSLLIMLYDDKNEPVFRYPNKIVNTGGDYIWQIPQDLSEGQHRINISYNQSVDDIFRQTIPINISGSTIVITSINPSHPTHKDSIRVEAFISDRQGIDTVTAYLQGDLLWVRNMVETGENNYSLVSPFPPQNPGRVVTLWFEVVDKDGNTTESVKYEIEIPRLPNLSPRKVEFKIDDAINLVVTVKNKTTGGGVTNVVLERKSEDGQWELLASRSATFEGLSTHEVKFPSPYKQGIWIYRISVNPDSSLDETNYSDNLLIDTLETHAFWVTPEIGTTDDLENHKSVGISGVTIDVPSGAVLTSKPIELLRFDNINLDRQPVFLPISADGESMGFEINSVLPVGSFNVVWGWTDQVPDSGGLYAWFPNYQTFLPIEVDSFSVDSSAVYFTTDLLTKFAWLYSEDHKGPYIEATVNGLRYLPKSYISTSPDISVIIQDESGVDFRQQSIKILTNGIDLLSNLEIPENSPPNVLTFRISPELSSSDTSLSIIAKDAAGNWSDTLNLTFIVREELDLIDYGNFPNPFKDKTMFAYELTHTVDDFSLEIFSVSGRKVISFNDETIISDLALKTAAYHEIFWDGKDLNGNFVDNGIYFYRIKAKLGKTSIERFGKIAKGR